MRLPGGLREVRGTSGMAAFTAPELEAWVREAVDRGEPLHRAAAREACAELRGRGPVHVVSTARGRWVVRRYQRGGCVASPLLGDRYLRLGSPRPMREASASHEARRRGIPTPRVMAGAVYPGGAFYRADLVTEYVDDSVDLAAYLFDGDPPSDERLALLRQVRGLVDRAAGAGIEHGDLNAKNVLVEHRGARAQPLLLDLDRCQVHPPATGIDARPMLARLRRSLRKHERVRGQTLTSEDWSVLGGDDVRGDDP